ncbi:hypothetical protein ACSZMI_07770 [Aeromonas veronii]
MIPESRFEQAHGVTASKLSYALTLMDKGDLEAARDVILDVQKTNEEQARVIDARVYGAVRHICESRKLIVVDSLQCSRCWDYVSLSAP